MWGRRCVPWHWRPRVGLPDNEHYVEGAWEVYHRDKALLDAGLPIPGFGAYLPNPDEIRQRAADVRWLQAMGFDDYFSDSVMMHGSPQMWVVRRMVARYGVEETYRRCEPFLAGKDGYGEHDI
jgi:hypothetical protein